MYEHDGLICCGCLRQFRSLGLFYAILLSVTSNENLIKKDGAIRAPHPQAPLVYVVMRYGTVKPGGCLVSPAVSIPTIPVPPK